MGVHLVIDAEALRHLKNADTVLGRLIDQVGSVELELGEDRFTALARAVAGQQLSVSAARTIWKRLVTLVGTIDAETIASTDREAMRSVGLSGAKAAYIADLAFQVREGAVNLAGIDRLQDEDAIRELMRIRGVGRWTAEMFLIFSLGRMDVFAQDDVGLQRAMLAAYGIDRSSSHALSDIAQRWRPYRSVASLYLWEALDRGLLES